MSIGIIAGTVEPELLLATRGEGLLAFNGARFRQILPADSDLRFITTVLALESGRVLIGTEHRGLLVFDGLRLTLFNDRLKTAHITALAGTEGDFWIGTHTGGAFHYRGGQLEELLSALPDPQVLSLAAGNGIACIGTPLGIVEFRNGERSRTLAGGFFARSLAYSGKMLHMGTEDEGIFNVSMQPRSAAATPDSPRIPILRIADLEGELYAVTENAIYHFDPTPRRWQRLPMALFFLTPVLSRARLWVTKTAFFPITSRMLLLIMKTWR